MTARPVRSERTEPVGPVVVVGDTPTARGIRHRLRLLGMTGGEETQSDDAAASRFAGARAVVLVGHTGDFARVGAQRVAPRRAALVAGVEQDLADAAAAGVEHVVAISSAMVNGAHPDRALIADDDPRLDEVDASYAGDVLTFEATIEAMAPAAAEAGMTVTVLRPAVLVGPDIDTLMTRHFEAPRVLTIRGVRREWQLVHVDDVADAVRVVVEQGLGGRLTVGALRDGQPDVLTPEVVKRIAGMRGIDLPAASAFGVAERLHRVGVLPAPASDMSFSVYPWTVSATTLRDAGWVPTWSSEACLRTLVAQVRGRVGVAGRRVGGLDAAALGAAGAAVALLGTAAILKQSRGRR
ncbi:NAD-dependent epimerase/dehydratase family protein [Sanguibacter suarezii]|uniref:NAD-dependent epimerase/dehydratase family protein n=1 Tax=Sanguibacter suarezii TaxID=60921 RepID=UPI0008324E28|nr:NAD-dependent epimerase/dehydratase family protein [Sanguibacter suarezii]